MDEEYDSKLQTLKIVSDVLICLGSLVVLLTLRALSSWFIRRCLLLDSNASSEDNSSSDKFVRNLCEMYVLFVFPY